MKTFPDMKEGPGDSTARIPSWAKRSASLRDMHGTKASLRKGGLVTVCEEARCPNITECFSRPSAAFLILGDTCTRSCAFCSISKGKPAPPPEDESVRVARAASSLKLKHVVITSVTRDDLDDQGSGAFADCIRGIRQALPESSIEVLVPDFSGIADLIGKVLRAGPDVFNHNVETVGSLYETIRPRASLRRSLEVLRTARELSPGIIVKSGFMVGLGETDDEVAGLLEGLHGSGCDVVTIGQYMQPTKAQVPVRAYRHPQDFERFSDVAKRIGIRYVVSGPLVRSSYQAGDVLERIRRDRS